MTVYKARSEKQVYKGKISFYPIIEFYTRTTGVQDFYKNDGKQETNYYR